MTDKCPKCGIYWTDRWSTSERYACGTIYRQHGDTLEQSDRCRVRELERQLAEAREQISTEYLRGREAEQKARATVENAYIKSLREQLAGLRERVDELERQLAEARCDQEDDARLLEVQRKCAAKLGMRYEGDQEWVLEVTQQLAEARQATEAIRGEYEEYQKVGVEEMRLARQATADAVEALRSLYDWQNGPPLVTYTKQWQAAMDKAEAVLKKDALADGENPNKPTESTDAPAKHP